MPGARVASGERVALRTVATEDVPFIQRAFTNPAIRYPLGTQLKNQDEIESWNEEANDDHFLVCIEGDDAVPGQPDGDDVRPIGAVTVEDAAWRRPEVHGEGYGKEGVSLVVDYVFRTYEHPTVGAGAYAFNEASRALLESLGFSEEGRTRKVRFVDGEYVDGIQYGLLRSEWYDGDDV